jgi:hypothetical protein
MEKWEISNRTRGAVEIGCVRSIALQPGERYCFGGTVPDALRWLEGSRRIAIRAVVEAQPSAEPEKPSTTADSRKKFRQDRPAQTDTPTNTA